MSDDEYEEYVKHGEAVGLLIILVSMVLTISVIVYAIWG